MGHYKSVVDHASYDGLLVLGSTRIEGGGGGIQRDGTLPILFFLVIAWSDYFIVLEHEYI